MLTVNMGPFPVPVAQFTLLLGLLTALVIGAWLGRSQTPDGKSAGIGSTLSDMLLIGIVAARAAFVVSWFELYQQELWRVIDIRDGGFIFWAGVLAALMVALWQGRRHAALRRPLSIGLLSGAVVWGTLTVALGWIQPVQSLRPEVALTTLAGERVTLAELANGQPLVLNLWASWCPPCRREMPVLAAAQQQTQSVRFVFANQGEDATAVLRYLVASKLALGHVVLDPRAALGKTIGSRALPTTLFYSASGELVDSHLGELSAASLASQLKKLQASAP